MAGTETEQKAAREDVMASTEARRSRYTAYVRGIRHLKGTLHYESPKLSGAGGKEGGDAH